MVSPELLQILVCPETQQALEMASEGVLERVNLAIRSGQLRNQGGDRVKKRIEEGLVRADGRVLYPVKDGIPVMLLDEAIRLETES